MSTRLYLVLGAVPVLALASALSAPHAASQQPVSAATARVDYTSGSSWLCRPGREDACAVDQSATVILPGGAMSLEVWQPHADPPVDCFYVYPTVSQEQAPNSSINAGPGERGVVVSQLARFASQCRVYAPLYRQITLLALRAATAGQPMTPDREMAYADVRDAWNDYLARDNGGRGVVLIGHSQGSGMLRRLIQEEIEGRPIESRIVSAMLIGTNVLVPEGQDVGGDFRSMPLCRSASQTGCVVSYVTFRSDVPPPPDSRFGRTSEPGMMVACTNPASLGGGSAGLNGYLSAGRAGLPPWVATGQEIDTPFVRAPGLLTGECVHDEHGSYLKVTVNPDPNGQRTDRIGGDVMAGSEVNATWGLHLVDVHVAMGDLVDLVGQQTRAYLARRGR